MAITSKGSYSITLNKTAKKMELFVSGKADPEAVQGFFDEYTDAVEKYNLLNMNWL